MSKNISGGSLGRRECVDGLDSVAKLDWNKPTKEIIKKTSTRTFSSWLSKNNSTDFDGALLKVLSEKDIAQSYRRMLKQNNLLPVTSSL